MRSARMMLRAAATATAPCRLVHCSEPARHASRGGLSSTPAAARFTLQHGDGRRTCGEGQHGVRRRDCGRRPRGIGRRDHSNSSKSKQATKSPSASSRMSESALMLSPVMCLSRERWTSSSPDWREDADAPLQTKVEQGLLRLPHSETGSIPLPCPPSLHNEGNYIALSQVVRWCQTVRWRLIQVGREGRGAGRGGLPRLLGGGGVVR